MPGDDAWLRLIHRKGFDCAEPTACGVDNEKAGDHDDSRKQQEHHRIGQDDPARARVQRKQRVADPYQQYGRHLTESGDLSDDQRHTPSDCE